MAAGVTWVAAGVWVGFEGESSNQDKKSSSAFRAGVFSAIWDGWVRGGFVAMGVGLGVTNEDEVGGSEGEFKNSMSSSSIFLIDDAIFIATGSVRSRSSTF